MAKVMLVEDDNNLREIYEARMQAEGYDVVSAKDGEEALVVAKAEKPELVISDVMMPKISGFEMLDILRNTDGLKDVKVIMLTALGQADDQQRADRLGADRYLVKSQVTLEDIVNVAHQLLGDLPDEVSAEPVIAATAEPVAVATAEPVATTVEPPVAVALAPAPEPEATTPAAVPVAATPIVADPEPALDTTQASQALVVAPLAADESVLPQTSFSAVQVEPPATAVAANPTAVAEPSANDAVPANAGDGAQSSAQEEAVVEAQIEDFVSGATSNAPAPVVAEVAQPSATAEQDTNAATDDKIMADAVSNLVSNTTAEPVPMPPAAELVITPSPESVVALSPAEETAATGAPVPDASVSMIAGKKIISPMSDAAAKPNLNDLLAKEEAKEIAAKTTSEAIPAPVYSAPPVDTSNKPDPSSISL